MTCVATWNSSRLGAPPRRRPPRPIRASEGRLSEIEPASGRFQQIFAFCASVSNPGGPCAQGVGCRAGGDHGPRNCLAGRSRYCPSDWRRPLGLWPIPGGPPSDKGARSILAGEVKCARSARAPWRAAPRAHELLTRRPGRAVRTLDCDPGAFDGELGDFLDPEHFICADAHLLCPMSSTMRVPCGLTLTATALVPGLRSLGRRSPSLTRSVMGSG
jgi:hypothetical protein